MKGIVFREFLDLVEDRFGLEIADRMISESALSTNGAYAATGTYNHGEMLSMVTRLSEHTGIGIDTLVKTYGRHLFSKLMDYATGLEDIKQSGLFTFLEAIDGKIHVDVRKIHPDAELPSFQTSRPCTDSISMEYRSSRPFADLAEGLLQGAIDYFQEDFRIEREDLEPHDGTAANFLIRRN